MTYRTRRQRLDDYLAARRGNQRHTRAEGDAADAIPLRAVRHRVAALGRRAAAGTLTGADLLDEVWTGVDEAYGDATALALADWSIDRHGVDYLAGWAHDLDPPTLAAELRDAWTHLARQEGHQ